MVTQIFEAYTKLNSTIQTEWDAIFGAPPKMTAKQAKAAKALTAVPMDREFGYGAYEYQHNSALASQEASSTGEVKASSHTDLAVAVAAAALSTSTGNAAGGSHGAKPKKKRKNDSGEQATPASASTSASTFASASDAASDAAQPRAAPAHSTADEFDAGAAALRLACGSGVSATESAQLIAQLAGEQKAERADEARPVGANDMREDDAGGALASLAAAGSRTTSADQPEGMSFLSQNRKRRKQPDRLHIADKFIKSRTPIGNVCESPSA